jgi:catechol 2,3-dioxygenase-like lactoylglutathione lyase family enzyme
MTASLPAGFDLDHTSFAVHDAMDLAKRLRRELGAVPIIGEALAEFRYLLLYVGTPDEGARLELLEPAGPGFLTRFLAASGEGPHHITFTVPDLRESVRRARSLGFTVVGENYAHPGWREAFIVPDAVHGTVIQLAQSDKAFPQAWDLLASRDRDPATLPNVAGATDQLWWSSLWDTDAPESGDGRLGATYLVSTDVDLSRQLFGDMLGGQMVEQDRVVEVSWPSGSVSIRGGEQPGITRMTMYGGPADDLVIGNCRIGSSA